MKLKTEVVIDADRATVWQFFDDPDNISKWQPTLKSFTLKSGVHGQPDAITELIYDENGRKVVLTETISARREPDFLAGTYESSRGSSVVFNHFEETEDGKTRWVTYLNQSFKGFMKIMAIFKQKSIVDRIEADMNRLKLLVETAVADQSS